MAQIITNYAAKKLLGSQLEKYKHKAVGGDDDVSTYHVLNHSSRSSFSLQMIQYYTRTQV